MSDEKLAVADITEIRRDTKTHRTGYDLSLAFADALWRPPNGND